LRYQICKIASLSFLFTSFLFSIEKNMGVNPPANVLGKMADDLGVSMDFLLHGSTDDKSASTLSHAEVIRQYKEVDQLAR